MIEKQNFGKLADGQPVSLFILENKNGLSVEIISFGAIIKSIKTPDKSGHTQNIVLGTETLGEYVNDHLFLGATIGRFCNRISKGKFELNGNTFHLPINNPPNHLHGGLNGFNKKLWNSEIFDEHTLKLSYESPDGEEGYPGNLKASVYFELSEENELKIRYQATTNAATPVNFTNHSYFNLHGDFSQTIHNHQLLINADTFTPFDEHHIPTGTIDSVQNTALDFTEMKTIGNDLSEGFSFDHNYVLNKDPQNKLKLAATLFDEESGRQLKVFSTEPGMQFYTGNSLDGSISDEDGNPFKEHTALCLETQHFPDSPNQPHFPNTILQPGETFSSETIYQFSIRERF